jgi:hypothetical protein
MATVRWLIAHGADPRKGARWLDGVPRRASTLADHYGYSEVGAYLRTCEERAEAAEAAARVEEALAARQVAGINPAAAPVERPPPLSNVLGDGLPDHLTCPVSLDLMEDPAVLAVDGCTYSRTAIERYFAARRHGM